MKAKIIRRVAIWILLIGLAFVLVGCKMDNEDGAENTETNPQTILKDVEN